MVSLKSGSGGLFEKTSSGHFWDALTNRLVTSMS